LSLLTNGVVDTVDNFAAGINDTSGQLSASVVDTISAS
jgi:hypothetical protein